jgi:hypothetical protein
VVCTGAPMDNSQDRRRPVDVDYAPDARADLRGFLIGLVSVD